MHLPHLSQPQRVVLAAWRWAMILTQSAGRTAVGTLLAAVWGQSEATVRQRLREWTYEAAATKGAKRAAVAVRILAGVVSGVGVAMGNFWPEPWPTREPATPLQIIDLAAWVTAAA